MKAYALKTLIWLQLSASILAMLLLVGTSTMPARAEGLADTELTIEDTATNVGQIETRIDPADGRSELIRQFAERVSPKSPLLPHVDHMVKISDDNGIDYRMIPAIGMCESNLGMRMPNKKGCNAWGIAVYTGTQVGRDFSSCQDGIAWVGNYIKTKYMDRGITNLVDIGHIWAPPSKHTNNSWSTCVDHFMGEIASGK